MAQAVDGTVAGGRGDPTAGVGRHAGLRPPLARNEERLLDHLFGDVDVAEETDQGGNYSAGFLSEDPCKRVGVECRHDGLRLGLVLERTNLDRTHARSRALRGPLERGVEVGCADDPEAAELFLRLGERTIGRDRLAVRDADDRGDVRRVESTAEDPGAGALTSALNTSTCSNAFCISSGGGGGASGL